MYVYIPKNRRLGGEEGIPNWSYSQFQVSGSFPAEIEKSSSVIIISQQKF